MLESFCMSTTSCLMPCSGARQKDCWEIVSCRCFGVLDNDDEHFFSVQLREPLELLDGFSITFNGLSFFAHMVVSLPRLVTLSQDFADDVSTIWAEQVSGIDIAYALGFKEIMGGSMEFHKSRHHVDFLTGNPINGLKSQW